MTFAYKQWYLLIRRPTMGVRYIVSMDEMLGGLVVVDVGGSGGVITIRGVGVKIISFLKNRFLIFFYPLKEAAGAQKLMKCRVPSGVLLIKFWTPSVVQFSIFKGLRVFAMFWEGLYAANKKRGLEMGAGGLLSGGFLGIIK
jgi:hypothetical protein